MKNLKFTERSIPLALFLLCVASLGLMIPWLGFYWDDWPIVFLTRFRGVQGIQEFLSYDRPLSGWPYMLLFPVLGFKPVVWHAFTLLLRAFTGILMWITLRTLWPHYRREVTWMAILFIIYPSFTEHPIAVTYVQVWIGYLLYFVSIVTMLQAAISVKKRWLYAAISVVALLLNLSLSEYFVGLELLRPLLLWYILTRRDKEKRWKSVFITWLPYLAILAAYTLWRLFLIEYPQGGGLHRPPVLLYGLFTQPLASLMQLFQSALQDILYLFTGAWYQTMQPVQFELSGLFIFFSIGISILAAGAVGIYLSHLELRERKPTPVTDKWSTHALVMGIAAALLGALPVWLIGHQAIEGLHGNRFTMLPMFGASIVIIALLEWLSAKRLQKIVLISILVGFAINFHLGIANSYRRSWDMQKQFYWQLYWRAPYIEPGTPVIAAHEILPYMGIPSTGIVLHVVYSQNQNAPLMDYWFFSMERLRPQIARLEEGKTLQAMLRSLRFEGKSTNSLFISVNSPRCLRIYADERLDNINVPEELQPYLSASNLERIKARTTSLAGLPIAIFGPEPEHTWCYYYEKADLARQDGDWQSIARLGNEAKAANLNPTDPVEWIPFIEGYAYTGQWEMVLALSKQIHAIDHDLDPVMCAMWQGFAREYPSASSLTEVLPEVYDYLPCAEQ